MSTTLSQYFADKPRLEVATRNLIYNKKLRRLVASTMEQLVGSTSPRDLAEKVLKEVSTPTNLTFLFGVEKLKNVDRQDFIYSKLELPIKLCCQAFTGLISKSTFEAHMTWQKSYSMCQHKTIRMNKDVCLAPLKDMNRVYVTNPQTEVAIVENISPFSLLDVDIKDRHKHTAPRTATFIKVDSDTVLYLFHSFIDGVQRRIQLPYSRVKNFTFKTLEAGYVQDGLQVVPRDLSGLEFEVSAHGEVVGEKRFGVTPSLFCFDQTHRGRRGDQGEKGIRGESGKNAIPFGILESEFVKQMRLEGKRMVRTKEDLKLAQKDGTGWYVQMSHLRELLGLKR